MSSLKTLANALDGRDYVTGIENLPDGSGYKILFANASPITVKNGTDGTDGDSAPVIGLREDTDGVYYWTLTSDGEPEWLLDADGNKMSVSGRDGESGFAPKIGVDDEGFWTVDQGNGPERVLDTDGAPINALGSKGSSFFTEVTHTAGSITFTFEDGTSITLKRQTTPAAITLEITNAETGINKFHPGATRSFTLSQTGSPALTVVKPGGWSVVVSNNDLKITAPNRLNNPYAEETGTVTLIGLSASGQMTTVSMTVGAGIAYARGDGSFLDVLARRTETGAIVEDAYGDVDLDDDNDGLILLSDAARVKYIDVSGAVGLSFFWGLEHFPALESLNCGNNNLTGPLDVSGLKNLKELYCYETNLFTLDVSGCVNLTVLWCYRNPNLYALDVSGLKNLQELDCSQGNLFTLDFSDCVNLEYLNCSATSLSGTLDVSGLKNLKELWCNDNLNLSDLKVSGCVNLRTLNSYSTNLSTLDVSGLTNLQALDCSRTNLDELDVSGLSALKYLGCGNSGGMPPFTVYVDPVTTLANSLNPPDGELCVYTVSYSVVTGRDQPPVDGVTVTNKP